MKSIVLLLILVCPAHASGTANEDALREFWEWFVKKVSDWDWTEEASHPILPAPPIDEDPSDPDPEEEGEE